jgi:hypothetical protein
MNRGQIQSSQVIFRVTTKHEALLLLLLLYKLPVFVLFVFSCCFVLLTPANFVIGFWAVKFARK